MRYIRNLRLGKMSDICQESVFNEIFRKYSKDLFNFLYYKYGVDNHPHDLVQETFLRLWKNCSKVHPDKVRSYLFTVANNQMLNELSKKKTVLKYQATPQKRHTSESPEYVMEENEYMGRLQNAIEELSEAQRVAFLLNRIEGKKHAEIAEILGISRKAVEKRIYTALANIREKIGDFL